MYITPEKYAITFRNIKRSSLSHSTCKLVIFVSCLDIDSLCAAKIFSLLLRKELIQYQLIPVVGYSDLKLHYSKLDDEVSNVFLIGCGAMLDLEGFFEIDPDSYVVKQESQTDDLNDDLREDMLKKNGLGLRRKIYIIDGHRPWSLDNVFGSSVVDCFDDGFIDGNLSELKDAYLNLVDDSGSDEDSESDIEESEDSDIESDFSEPNSQDSEITSTRKRSKGHKRTKRIKKQKKREKAALSDKLQEYYNQGTTVMTASSAIVYGFLTAIGETSIENLWLAIIGTSSLDSYYPEVYDKLQPIYKDEVLRLNPSNQNSLTEKTADTALLSIERDYHLFLLRHWTLYDSFFYSSHVNSKLNLWTEDGKKKLHKLFAKMGVSLAVAQQKWLYMDIRVKKQLPVIFNKYLPMYGLEGIVRDGFLRTFGYTGQLSAMECVESLTALLELDQQFLAEETEPDEESEDARITNRISKKEKAWVNNFWSSWDALNMTVTSTSSTVSGVTNQSKLTFKKSKGLELLMEGLEHAKEIQQIIFRTGMSLLERRLVKNMRTYRLCVLNDGSIPDLKIFNNPLMLSKLGSWLVENITELDFVNNKKSLKPFVVASLDVFSDSYLVIGLAPKYPRGMDNTTRARLAQEKNGAVTMRLNTFSVIFQQLANTSGAKVRIDSFDSSVIEIRKDDLVPFLEKLAVAV